MRQSVLILGFTFFSIFVTGCSSHDQNPLKIGSIAWAGYAPLFIAEQQDSFETSRIKLTTVPSSTDVLRLLESGLIDAGALTLGEALTAISHGLHLKIILIMDYSNGADVLVAQPEIHTIAELKGKRIAKEPTVIASVMLSMALNKAGLSLHDVSVRELYAHDHLQAFAKGKVDAVVSYMPYSRELLEKGGNVIFDSSQIPRAIADVLAVREDALHSKARQLETLVADYYAATSYIREHPGQAAGIVAAKVGSTPAEVSESLQGLRLPGLDESATMLTGSPSPLDLSTRRQAGIMRRAGLLDEVPELIEISDSSFLKKLQH